MKRSKSRVSGLLAALLLTSLPLSLGCGSDENSVVEPAGSTPTAAEEAAYEDEVNNMIDER